MATSKPVNQQEQSNLKWVADFIWNIADGRLRDVYVRGKYRDVILPFTVLRRLDAVLESTKHAVLERKKFLDTHKVAEQDGALRMASGQAFYNTSEFTLATLSSSGQGQRLRDNFVDYLDGFSPNVQDILAKFKFRDQIQTMVEADILGHLINDFLDPEVNLSPLPVKDADGRIKLPALDNHGMGTVFEELIRRFNEENNEEAGEHFTPRDVVQLMANLLFLPVADKIQSGTYLMYDGSCGTGGMLTVAEEALHDLAASHNKEVSIHLFGQEINPETYAICKADLLLKGEGDEAENIVGGADKSTLSADQFRSREFDFMISNPPYGKSWKTDLDRMGGKKEFSDSRFIVNHGGDAEFKLITRSSDGQLMFLVNKLQKMKHNTPLGSRIALVHNGSALFTGDAGQGESNTRAYVAEYIGRSTGIRSSRLRLYPNQFLDISLLQPPRPEQDQIVAYLRAQDAHVARLIKAKRDLIGLLSEQKLRIIDHAVTRGLDDLHAHALQAMRPINAEDVLLHDGRVDDGWVLGVFCSDKRVDLTTGQILDGIKEVLHGYFL